MFPELAAEPHRPFSLLRSACVPCLFSELNSFGLIFSQETGARKYNQILAAMRGALATVPPVNSMIAGDLTDTKHVMFFYGMFLGKNIRTDVLDPTASLK